MVTRAEALEVNAVEVGGFFNFQSYGSESSGRMVSAVTVMQRKDFSPGAKRKESCGHGSKIITRSVFPAA